MTTISLIALFVYVLGAFAYGSAFALSLRQAVPVWASPPHRRLRGAGHLDRASLTLFAYSAVWFVVCIVLEFETLTGVRGFSPAQIVGIGLTYGFPPLIMHTMYNESRASNPDLSRWWTRGLVSGYVVSFGLGLWIASMLAGLAPAIRLRGSAIGLSIGALFLACTAYCVGIMLQQRRVLPPSSPERRGRVAIFTAFGVMTLAIFALTFLRDFPHLITIVERAIRGAPLLFLGAATYFEHRFEFYDLVIKRGATLLASLAATGAAVATLLPWVDQLPAGVPAPWLLTLGLVPVVMLTPWLHGHVSRLLDLVWFGRHYTPAEAVSVVLARLQQATDEPSLIEAAETGFIDIFRVPIRLQTTPPGHPAAQLVVPVAGPDGQAVLWTTARQETGHLLSEDQALLRSLGKVVVFLLENLRLQARRKAQERLEHELRLQTSRSELKALRAQINPHFLFNALNAIASLIHTDPARADAAVEQLAEVFRYTLRRSESEWAPLDQELAFAEAYLDVEQARFGPRLAYTVEADPKVRGVMVPSMVLHTLVENAVKHGISVQRAPGRILVRTRLVDGGVRLEVHDTGPGPAAAGPDARRAEGERFGLRSVRDRLEGHFNGRASFTLTRDEAQGVTIAAVELPLTGPADVADAGGGA